jgi:hypothetical protein
MTKSHYIPMAILRNEIVTIHLRQRNNQYRATVVTVSYIRTHPVPNTLIIITYHQYPKQYYSIQTSYIFNNDNVLSPFIKIYRNHLFKNLRGNITAQILLHSTVPPIYKYSTHNSTNHPTAPITTCVLYH